MLSCFCLIALTLAPADGAGNWPQWRGPKRDGISTDTGLLTEWPKDGPKLLWETKGAGRGYASLAITGGRIYTMGDKTAGDDENTYAVCFEESGGKPVWKTKLSEAWSNGSANWHGSRSTPTVDGEHIYYMTPQGDLVCLMAADGKDVWRKNMKTDFSGGKGEQWGYSESPLIDGEKVVVTPGKANNTMVALNKKTGATIWSTSVPEDAGAGHASIVVSEVGNTRVYVQTTHSHVLGVRASDGKLLWKYSIKATAVIPTPIVKDDLVMAIAGYGTGGALLRQVPSGDNGIRMEEIYGYNTKLNNKHGGVILIGEKLYGGINERPEVFRADLMTGKVDAGWGAKTSGSGSAAITAANGHLYIRFSNGICALVNADAKDYKEISTFKIPHVDKMPSWSHPVVTGGRLYLREGDWIMCYDVKNK